MGSSAKFNVYAALEGLGPIALDAEAPRKFGVAAARTAFVAFEQERDKRSETFLLEVSGGGVALTRVEAELTFSKAAEGEEEQVSKTVGLFKRAKLAPAGSDADSLEFLVGREDSDEPDEDDELFAPLRAAPAAAEEVAAEKRPAADELADVLQANLRRLHPAEETSDEEEVSDID